MQVLLERLPTPQPQAPTVETQLPSYNPQNPQMERVDDDGAVVRMVAKMGGKGELDELFVALGLARRDRDTLGGLVMHAAGGLGTEGLVEEVFAAVTQYVKGHPFED